MVSFSTCVLMVPSSIFGGVTNSVFFFWQGRLVHMPVNTAVRSCPYTRKGRTSRGVVHIVPCREKNSEKSKCPRTLILNDPLHRCESTMTFFSVVRLLLVFFRAHHMRVGTEFKSQNWKTMQNWALVTTDPAYCSIISQKSLLSPSNINGRAGVKLSIFESFRHASSG